MTQTLVVRQSCTQKSSHITHKHSAATVLTRYMENSGKDTGPMEICFICIFKLGNVHKSELLTALVGDQTCLSVLSKSIFKYMNLLLSHGQPMAMAMYSLCA